MSSEAGKAGGPARMGHSPVPGTVPAALGLSWGVGIIGSVFQIKQQKPRESPNLLPITQLLSGRCEVCPFCWAAR